MHIAVDIREACRGDRAGKGQWVYGFVSELLTRALSLLLISDAPIPSEWQQVDSQVVTFPSGIFWHYATAGFLKTRSDVDLYLSPTSTIVPFLLGSSFAYALVVHDMIAFRAEPHNFKAKVIEHLTLGRAMRHARHVCTVSESTKRDLLKCFPSVPERDVPSIYGGPMECQLNQEYSRESTILCIGTLCPRKNQERLIRAYTLLPEDLRSTFQLILVGGRGWGDRPIINLAQATAGVEWIGYASPKEYTRLLRCCTILALPSLYEGFGLPLLDALKSGVPILTSTRGAIPEVVGEAAVFVDPEDEKDIGRGLEKLLRSEELQAKLRSLGPPRAEKFSWKRTVDLFLEALES